MKKYYLLVTIFTFIVFINKAKAQHYNNKYREDTWHVTLGPDFLAVVNPQQLSSTSKSGYVNYSRVGIGAQVRAEYFPSPFVGLSFGTGFSTIPVAGKNTANLSAYQLVPFKIGVKAFFSQTMYLGAEVGMGYMNPQFKASHSNKIIAPALGYNDNDTGLDVSLRYELDHFKSTYISVLGLHVAYSFDLTN